MINDVTRKHAEKTRFSFCPQCGRKGLYHIKPQYLRCRYCGTYMVSPVETKETSQPAPALAVTQTLG
jgi:hypothetical protein